MSDTLYIWPIAGELGRFHVESRSLVCSARPSNQRPNGCSYSWSQKPNSRKIRKSGDPCPKCGRKLVKAEPHLCDVNLFDGLGKCSCDYWRFSLGPLITRMTKEERFKVRRAWVMRCRHLQEALIVDALLTIDRRQNPEHAAKRKRPVDGLLQIEVKGIGGNMAVTEQPGISGSPK